MLDDDNLLRRDGVVAGLVALDDGCLTASAALTAGNVRCTQCDAEAVAVTASG